MLAGYFVSSFVTDFSSSLIVLGEHFPKEARLGGYCSPQQLISGWGAEIPWAHGSIIRVDQKSRTLERDMELRFTTAAVSSVLKALIWVQAI